jgi:hypothetical protein
MTGLAIIGLVLFGVVIGLMALAFLQETVRDFRGLKRATVRVRFSRRGKPTRCSSASTGCRIHFSRSQKSLASARTPT